MDILFLLIPLSVVLVFVIGTVFWLALKSGQFDDLEGPGLKVILDDDTPPQSSPNAEGARETSEDRSARNQGQD